MSWPERLLPALAPALGHALDVVSALCLVLGSLLALSAGVALVRFPDLLSRMHAGTKPQVVGLLLLLLGAALQVEGLGVVAKLALVAVFQLITVPVGTHLLARAAYRAGAVDVSALQADELAPELGRAPGEPVAADDGAAAGGAARVDESAGPA